MNRIVLLLICCCLISCIGDGDDDILDGDLITAIISENQIFTTSSGFVDYEFTPGENGTMTQAFLNANAFSDDFSMNLFFDASSSSNIILTNFQSNSFIYITYTDNVRKAYSLDTSANNVVEILRVNKNSIEGFFEITMINAEDPTDTIDFKEGYFYSYD